MRIDLHCPVELTDYELLHDDRGKARAYLKLNNLSARRLCRVECAVTFTDAEGGEAKQAVAQDVDAAPRKPFTLAVAADALPGATGVWVSFLKLKFENGPDWIGHPSRLVDIPDLPAPDGRELNRLMAVAGRDAICFARRAGTYWVCVCARPNYYRRQRCARCGRARDQVLSTCDMAQVLSSKPLVTPSGDRIELPLMEAKPGRKAGDGSAQHKLRKKFLRQRSLLIRRTITMAVIALLIALGAWLVGMYRASTQPPDSIPPIKMQQRQAV